MLQATPYHFQFSGTFFAHEAVAELLAGLADYCFWKFLL
jgi:hypothetical protein